MVYAITAVIRRRDHRKPYRKYFFGASTARYGSLYGRKRYFTVYQITKFWTSFTFIAANLIFNHDSCKLPSCIQIKKLFCSYYPQNSSVILLTPNSFKLVALARTPSHMFTVLKSSRAYLALYSTLSIFASSDDADEP